MTEKSLKKEINELKRQIKELKERQDRDWSAQFAGYPGYE